MTAGARYYLGHILNWLGFVVFVGALLLMTRIAGG